MKYKVHVAFDDNSEHSHDRAEKYLEIFKQSMPGGSSFWSSAGKAEYDARREFDSPQEIEQFIRMTACTVKNAIEWYLPKNGPDTRQIRIGVTSPASTFSARLRVKKHSQEQKIADYTFWSVTEIDEWEFTRCDAAQNRRPKAVVDAGKGIKIPAWHRTVNGLDLLRGDQMRRVIPRFRRIEVLRNAETA